MRPFVVLLLMYSFFPKSHAQHAEQQPVIPGYRGIWFELNQKYPFGDKYSGGLGTYTAKHIPLAIYAPAVNKTFFVYGGTPSASEKHLLCMIGAFDHATGKVSQPRVVFDKAGVNDPHDDPVLMIDDEGYIWVFASGRGNTRPGIKLRSHEPYSIDRFEEVSRETFAYPQLWKGRDAFLHLFTKYTGRRELYFEKSGQGRAWTEDVKLSGIREDPGEEGGHYQVSALHADTLLGTFFNRHPQGNVDKRTDLYYMESRDGGNTWQNVRGTDLDLPLETVENPCRVIDYQAEGKNVYMKDMAFTDEGHPVVLYLTSGGHEPGPDNAPYTWTLTRWDGKEWRTSRVCASDHNYDMGSLFLAENAWHVVGPTETGPQAWGTGGELAHWVSHDSGMSWSKTRVLTRNSPRNHAYVRRVLNGRAPFHFFWADGNSDSLSISRLYFGDLEGNMWQLPYEMEEEWEKPLPFNPQ